MKAFDTTTVNGLLKNSTRIWITGAPHYKGAIDDLSYDIIKMMGGLQLEIRGYHEEKSSWDHLWLRVDWVLIPQENNRQAVLLAASPYKDERGDNRAAHDFHVIIEASTSGRFTFIKNRMGHLLENISTSDVLIELERSLTIPDVTRLQYAQGVLHSKWATYQLNRSIRQWDKNKRRKVKED